MRAVPPHPGRPGRRGGLAAVAQEFLVRGELVGIFPEATISRAMEVKELKTGAVRIAAAAGVPLIPVVVWGTQRMMTKDHDKDFGRGKAITIKVGAPVPVTGADPVAETAQLRTAMSGLLDEAIRDYPQHEPGAWWVPASYGGTAPTLDQAAILDAEEKAARAAPPRGSLTCRNAIYVVLSLCRLIALLTSDWPVGAVARIHDVDDPAQVVERGELDRDLALAAAELDLDPGLQPVGEALGQVVEAGRHGLAPGRGCGRGGARHRRRRSPPGRAR